MRRAPQTPFSSCVRVYIAQGAGVIIMPVVEIIKRLIHNISFAVHQHLNVRMKQKRYSKLEKIPSCIAYTLEFL